MQHRHNKNHMEEITAVRPTAHSAFRLPTDSLNELAALDKNSRRPAIILRPNFDPQQRLAGDCSRLCSYHPVGAVWIPDRCSEFPD